MDWSRRRRQVVRRGVWWDLGFLRGVPSLETRTDSGRLLAAPPSLSLTVKYVQDQRVFSARLWSGRARSNGSREGGWEDKLWLELLPRTRPVRGSFGPGV